MKFIRKKCCQNYKLTGYDNILVVLIYVDDSDHDDDDDCDDVGDDDDDGDVDDDNDNIIFMSS